MTPPLSLTKSITMKRNRILLSAFVALALLLGSPITKAQQTYFLNVDSIIGIPDTVYDGSTVTFTMVFSNVSNLGFQGDVETWLQVQGTADSTQADSTVWSGNNFMQAQSQTQVTVTHLFSSQDNSLAIGDNVVVVWPRIVSGQTYPPQEVTERGMVDFYLAEPLGTGPDKDQSIGRLGLYPNPAQGSVRLSLPGNETADECSDNGHDGPHGVGNGPSIGLARHRRANAWHLYGACHYCHGCAVCSKNGGTPLGLELG
jgi:hypothetical protein